jgi:lysophospholipase L1-like esterase
VFKAISSALLAMKITTCILIGGFLLSAFFNALRAENNTAIQPVPRLAKYWENRDDLGWVERHGKILVRNQKGPVDLIFLGDSITHGFENIQSGNIVWQRDFTKWNPVNMGFGGDKTEHVLWRIDNGTLDNISPKVVVVMIGTNNWRSNKPSEIAEGVVAVCDAIHAKVPQTKVLLLAVFPRNDPGDAQRIIVDDTNAILEKTHFPDWVTYLDIGSVFLNEESVITREIMPDLLHPSAEGYELWSGAILSALSRLMGE